jgi:phage baseplate assembly protein W
MTQLYDRIQLPAIKKKNDVILPKTYKGFSTLSGNAGNYSLYDFELIKQDIINHFHIRQGERLMQPTFGTIIWDVLFEPLTEDIKSIILEDVNRIINYDPRVSITDTNISVYNGKKSGAGGLQIMFLLTYSPYNITEQIKLQFDEDNGLSTG